MRKIHRFSLCLLAILIWLVVVFPLRVYPSVIGDDGRVWIRHTEYFRYGSIVALHVTRTTGQSGVVTGFLVDEYHVLTAAHNVYFDEGFFGRAEVIPGKNGTERYTEWGIFEVIRPQRTVEPFGRAIVTGARVFPSWAAGNGEAGDGYDVALLTLDRNVGFYTGYMELYAAPEWDPIYYATNTYVAGYPDEAHGKWVKNYMYEDGDQGAGADEYKHWYYMDTSPGMSGSPVWLEYQLPPPTQYRVLSVHTYGDNGINHGTRISQDKLDQLNDWMSQDTPPIDYADLAPDYEDPFDYGFTPNSVVRGETDFNVWAGVRNLGTAASGSFTVHFVLSNYDDPRQIGSSDFILASVDVPSINPFQTRHVSWSGPFPVNARRVDGTIDRIPLTGAGGYYVHLVIDINDDVTEFDEVNNLERIPRDDGSGLRVEVQNSPPIADADGDYWQQPGVPIVFDGSASYDPDGYITSYEWDFGDGETGTGVNPTHTYTQEGTYTATLTVKDDKFMTPDEDQDDALVTIKRRLIESCDAFGITQDSFYPSEDIHVVGSGYTPSTMFPIAYPIYVVEDTTWTDGMSIPARVPGTATSVFSDAGGNVGPKVVWSNPLIPGRFDIVVDFNRNNLYDEGIDALDDMDIEASAGFSVVLIVDVVSSDPDGSFTVTIDVGADKGAPITSLSIISTTNVEPHIITFSDDQMVMVIEGQLLDASLGGQLVLEVDPVGTIITYEINIAPYEAPTEVPEFGFSAAIMMSLAAMIYLLLRKRMAKKSAGGR